MVDLAERPGLARPARAMGPGQLRRLSQRLRQPRHPRRVGQDRAAGRDRLALHNDTTWCSTIRDDIKFQDGTPLTPDDVVFSVQRITDPAFKSPQLSQFDQITGAEVSRPARR